MKILENSFYDEILDKKEEETRNLLSEVKKALSTMCRISLRHIYLPSHLQSLVSLGGKPSMCFAKQLLQTAFEYVTVFNVD